MLDLLGRAPCALPLAGGLLERRGISVHTLVEEEAPGEAAEFAVKDMAGLGTWLKARGVQTLGLARKDAISGAEWIRQLSQSGVEVEWVRMAGVMKQARAASGILRQQAARVVAERLADPLRGYLDLLPDELGLGEYLDRVDAGLLRLALEDARQMALWQRENGAQIAPTVRGAAINPLVRGLDDLHPGMEFAGTVVNLTGFGAFVELGLDVQGLVHLSELSTDFIRHPSEVVSVGQRVRVRVLELDRARGRLSLSMKENRAEVTRKGRPKRVESLKALDELFKKG
ncbi:MAG: S1 RNA-binding domain-containing protein [Deltaproteobacteria bacterium]|nr:S1 RNA-binding domain-containing protein [Deltaproteobacteria bacterium]